MHGAALGQAFGCVGAVLSVGLNAPQAWTSCRHRLVSGLSPAARWLAVVQSASWVAYGWVEGVPLQVATNLVCTALHVAVLVALLVLTPSARRPGVAVPQAVLALLWMTGVVVLAAAGSGAVGVVAAVAGALSVVPQVWRLARDRGQDASGVSRTTTVLSLAASLCWAAHGVLLLAPAVVLASLAGAGAAAWTLALLRPPAATPDERAVPVPLGHSTVVAQPRLVAA